MYRHTKETVTFRNFGFESGPILDEIHIRYETWGQLNKDRNNAILVTHALTGTSHAAKGAQDSADGWWEIMIGPGKPFDPTKYYIICANAIGGCSGSTGPASTNPATGRPFGLRFPVVTVRDMVIAQNRLLDHLGVAQLRTVAGGSMGGMQALEWAAMFPNRVDSAVAMGAPGRAYPQSIAFRKAQRKAIMLDPVWNGGDYYGRGVPENGINTARFMGVITYRSEREFAERFGRDYTANDLLAFDSTFAVEDYLEHHGQKLASWFDANTYLYLSKAMDLHDLGRGFSSYEAGVRRITCPLLVIGFDSDLLFPCYQQQEIVQILHGTNPHAEYYEVTTLYGHDAFLIEAQQLTESVADFLTKY